MIQVGSRVRHKNEEIDSDRGIMSVINIKNGVAVCGYLDFHRLGVLYNYNLSDLKIAER